MQELLDKLAEERYGEFGFTTCTEEQQKEIFSHVLKMNTYGKGV